MNTTSIVAGGRKNAVAGLRKKIRSDVRAEFANRFTNAGFVQRILLRLQMWVLVRKQVRAEAKTVAPRGGQYLSR